MNAEKVKIGVIGTGMISNVVAQAIQLASNATLAAVSSRSINNAKAFASEHLIGHYFDSWQQLLKSDGIDAVYIGVPTVAKEEIALEAARNGKHLLVDKPFTDYESVKRMTKMALDHQVVFMDATHFVHHPRTKYLKESIPGQIGLPQALRTSFFFPFLDRTNIRYNPSLEPTGAVGDMAWYSARAMVEYLDTSSEISDIKSYIQRDPETGAVFRGAGMLRFDNGSTSNWDYGYNAGVCVMDLDLLGSEGLISMDDFVLDWSKGFAFDNDSHQVGYTLRKGMATPGEFKFISTNTEQSQATLMIENFVKLVLKEERLPLVLEQMEKTERTQMILDAIWEAAISNEEALAIS